MKHSTSISISRSKRGTSIKASGAAAQAIFDAMTTDRSKVTKSARAIAYCWANGRIDITDGKVPDGAIWIARGEGDRLRRLMDVVARHGYEEGVLLVPGIPEARNQKDGGDALEKFLEWLASRSDDGIEINRPRAAGRPGAR